MTSNKNKNKFKCIVRFTVCGSNWFIDRSLLHLTSLGFVRGNTIGTNPHHSFVPNGRDYRHSNLPLNTPLFPEASRRAVLSLAFQTLLLFSFGSSPSNTELFSRWHFFLPTVKTSCLLLDNALKSRLGIHTIWTNRLIFNHLLGGFFFFSSIFQCLISFERRLLNDWIVI